MSFYTTEFYDAQADGSYQSAVVVSEIFHSFLPQLRSVVDVGCGTGTWVKAFLGRGIERGIGVDGDYVHRNQLRIPESNFVPKDLTLPLSLGERFDLCVSMEVAEHLPASRAASFVQDLTKLAPVVLFSAAIPQQGGTNHINEQWPEYWAELFARQGYRTVDCLRSRLWNDPRVEYFYRQNAFLFANDEFYAQLESVPKVPMPLSIVHPAVILSRRAPTRRVLLEDFWAMNKWSVQVRLNRLRKLFA